MTASTTAGNVPSTLIVPNSIPTDCQDDPITFMMERIQSLEARIGAIDGQTPTSEEMKS